MGNPGLIATLTPIDRRKWTEKAFRSDLNRRFYQAPTHSSVVQNPASSDGGATFSQAQPDGDNHCWYDGIHRLQLTLEKPPKDPRKGYSFGSDPSKCDIVLNTSPGISAVHFWITFLTLDKNTGKYSIMLIDSSSHGTSVAYDGQARNEIRRDFPWVLDLAETAQWEIQVHVASLSFIIEFASHKTCESEYEQGFRDMCQNIDFDFHLFDKLEINSHTTTAAPSRPVMTLKQSPIYISLEEVASGSFGVVDKVVNASTGMVFARKRFFRDNEISEDQFFDAIENEIRIMRQYPHENIVQLIYSELKPEPFLVMPYFELKSVAAEYKIRPFSVPEVMELSLQVLDALKFLHASDVAHRDLKPLNILVASRYPLRIKLADFGLAKANTILNTYCGSPIYMAPEVYRYRQYQTSVDLWSLGVIMLEYLYGLPDTNELLKRSGMARCSFIIDHANNYDSTRCKGLSDLLTDGMLRMVAKERFSAGACFEILSALQSAHLNSSDLSDSFDSGEITPTRTTVIQGERSIESDLAKTVVYNASDPEHEISDLKGKGRAESSDPHNAPEIPGSSGLTRLSAVRVTHSENSRFSSNPHSDNIISKRITALPGEYSGEIDLNKTVIHDLSDPKRDTLDTKEKGRAESSDPHTPPEVPGSSGPTRLSAVRFTHTENSPSSGNSNSGDIISKRITAVQSEYSSESDSTKTVVYNASGPEPDSSKVEGEGRAGSSDPHSLLEVPASRESVTPSSPSVESCHPLRVERSAIDSDLSGNTVHPRASLSQPSSIGPKALAGSKRDQSAIADTGELSPSQHRDKRVSTIDRRHRSSIATNTDSLWLTPTSQQGGETSLSGRDDDTDLSSGPAPDPALDRN